MSIPVVRRTLVFLLLALALTASAATAAGQAPASPRGVASSGAAPLDILGHLWSFLTKAWIDEGCYIDPNGCAPKPAVTAQQETGCMVDPNGRCATPPAPTVLRDEGCYIDPDGRCRG
jgi:hypothetical protein